MTEITGSTGRNGRQMQMFALIARTLLSVALMMFALAATRSRASEVYSTSSCAQTSTGRDCSFYIKIEGEITQSTPDALKKALDEYKQMVQREGSDWLSIMINSPGGSVDAAIQMGRLLRSMNAPIAVSDDQMCVSACVLVLAGAPHRLIGGRIGIHRPYFETPRTDVSVAAVQAAYRMTGEKIRSYLREMNVSETLAADMMLVPPDKIRFLSRVEIAGYGLGILDPVAAEASDLQEAKKLGIDRRELMRRRSLSQ